MQGFDHSYRLRPELEILKTAGEAGGQDSWIIHDPTQHRYFRIDPVSRQLLADWQITGSLQEALARWSGQHGQQIDEAELTRLMEFVLGNHLVSQNKPDHWRDLSSQAKQGEKSTWHKLAHNYLFFKLPLWHPQSWLETNWPRVRLLFTPIAALIVALLGLVGLYQVSRQWDQFAGTFDHFFSPLGLSLFVLALVMLKSLHELGHAFMATRFGCRVPVMGLAFMLLTPMLYTDVSDAWRLQSRRQRLLISGAGVMVELAVAALATLLWVYMPEGIGRSLAFMLATTGWIMSLALNLNPCMRFDGYYLFSDLLGIDNLQPRAFAFGRWKIRQWLFAPDLPAPEQQSSFMRRVLILYAWVTWIYRLIVFTAIALMVYHFAFKLLGLLLFALEIWLLILLPIGKELKAWRGIDPAFVSPLRGKVTVGLVAMVVLLLAVPWSGRISAPAIMVAADVIPLYPSHPAQIIDVSVKAGEQVQAGQPLLALEVPQIEAEIRLASLKHDLLDRQIGQAVSDPKQLQHSPVLKQQDQAVLSRLSGLREQQQQLTMIAPQQGKVIQVAANLHAGRWVDKTQLLALIATSDRKIIKAYVAEKDLERLHANAEGQFIPNDLSLSSLPVRLNHLASANSAKLDHPELASIHHGRIAVYENEEKQLVPVDPYYLAELSLVEPSTQAARKLEISQTANGVIHLKGESRSLLYDGWQLVVQVIRQESGF